MSLGHWPVMAFAKAGASAQSHAMTLATGTHAHHHVALAEPDHDPTDVTAHQHGGPNQPAICTATGCCIVIAPPPVSAPASGSSLLGRLHPAPARAIIAAPPDPADQPPRLQA